MEKKIVEVFVTNIVGQLEIGGMFFPIGDYHALMSDGSMLYSTDGTTWTPRWHYPPLTEELSLLDPSEA